MENNEQPKVEKMVCRVLNPIRLELLARRLATMGDKFEAFELMKGTFEDEVERTVNNRIVHEVSPEKAPLQIIRNTSDKGALFPVLAMAVKEKADDIFKDKKRVARVSFWVDTFMDDWQKSAKTGGSLKPGAIPQADGEKPQGRPRKCSFDDCRDKATPDEWEKIKEDMHTRLKGKFGKDFCDIIREYIDAKTIIRPTYGQCKAEFGDKFGSEQTYCRNVSSHYKK